MKLRQIAETMQKVDRRVLYLVLVVVTSIALFIPVKVPNRPDRPVQDLYHFLMTMPADRVVLLQSDWTNSTRGESLLNMEALLRILMRREIRFVMYSGADPQAPQVARNVIDRINAERVADGQRRYEVWNDWIDLGFFPDLTSFANAMSADVRAAWRGRKNPNPELDGAPDDVFNSPVLRDIRGIEDAGLLINVTASGTIDVLVQRLSPKRFLEHGEEIRGKVPLGLMCTGVMGPQALPFHQAQQVVGISVGMKGAFDLEYMMEHGLNYAGEDGVIHVQYEGDRTPIRGFPGERNLERASRHYFSLQVALGLLILAVVAGNVGLMLTRKRGNS